MKKLSLLLTLLLAALVLPQSCSYDDSDLWQAVDDLDYRVGALEEAVKNLTTQTTALQQLIDKKLFIEKVEVDADGNYVLYTITPDGKTSTITIKNGKDGNDGNSGATPSAPNIGVERDGEGNYYWTVDGERLLDSEGNPVPVNGTNGAQGTDGKTPTFKIEDGKWWVSFDNGIEWTGPYGQATGADGDAFFKDVTISPDGKHVVLTLIDGTEIVLELYKEFNIAFDGIDNVLVMPGQDREITFRITNPTPNTTVEAFGKDGWEAKVEQTIPSAGLIHVSAPADRTGAGRVVVFVSDGDQKTLMRTLSFVSGAVELSTSSTTIGLEGGTGSVEVTTSVDFTAEVAQDSADWLSLIQGRAYETHTETISFSTTPNTTPYARVGRIYLKHEGYVIETILIIQEQVKYDPKYLVLVVSNLRSSNGKVSLGSFDLPGQNGVCTIDWGDGSPVDELKNTGSSQASMKYSHVYDESYWDKEVVVLMNGNLANWIMSSPTNVVDVIQWGDISWGGITIRSLTKMKHLAGREGGFPRLTAAEFRDCVNLASIDPDFFANSPEFATASYLFRGCTSLVEIPEGLFRNNMKIRNLMQMYENCTNLTKPAPMYMKDGLSTPTIRAMFRNCVSLKEIPDGLFTKEFLGSVTSYNSLFEGCTSLTEVPEFVYDIPGSTREGNTSSMFLNCIGLKSVDFNRFFEEGPGRFSNSVASTFMGCKNLTGSIPPTSITVNGTTYTFYPWQRLSYLNHSDMDVRQAVRERYIKFETYHNPSLSSNVQFGISKCVDGCVNLDGYFNLIPLDFGGGWDGTTEKPKISLKGELAPGAEYYAINYTMKTQGAMEAYYWLGHISALESWLPKYNNDITLLCRERGEKFWPEDLAKLNSSEGHLAQYDGCEPNEKYVLVLMAKNMFGETYKRIDTVTNPIPKGEPNYENFIGKWKVTSTGSTSAVKPDCGDVNFELEVIPYRVNNSYLVSGWGGSIWAKQGAVRFIYENGKVGVYSGNFPDNPLSMVSVIKYGVPYDDGEGVIYYNVGYCPYTELPNGAFYWYFCNLHLMLQGEIKPDTFQMKGMFPAEMKEAGLTNPCQGLEIYYVMGGPGWEKHYLPSEAMEPENRITVDGKEYSKFSLAPYTLTKVGAASSPAQRALRMQPKGATLLFPADKAKAYSAPLNNKVMKIQSHGAKARR